MEIVISLLLIFLGMVIDAVYQRKIRIAESYAYDTGREDGEREERLRGESRGIIPPVRTEWPLMGVSMAKPVEMPDGFEERMRKHGRATARIR